MGVDPSNVRRLGSPDPDQITVLRQLRDVLALLASTELPASAARSLASLAAARAQQALAEAGAE